MKNPHTHPRRWPFERHVRLLHDGSPVDLSAWTVSMRIISEVTGQEIACLTAEATDDPEVLRFRDGDTSDWPLGWAVYDVVAKPDGDDPMPPTERGRIQIVDSVTAPEGCS
jgi:hypothetical protein